MRISIAATSLLALCACSFDYNLRESARVEIMNFRAAIDSYRAKTGAFPSQLADLRRGWEIPFLYNVPRDPWDREYLYLQPHCLLSRGPDGQLGTADDVQLECAPELINQRVLVEAGLNGEVQRRDVYGRKIRFIHSGSVLMAWSYGQDGKADTADDQVARIAARAVRRD